MKWDIELNPRAEVRIKFTEEKTIEYRVEPLDGTGGELEGTVTVGEQSSGIRVILIYDDGLEPADVLVKTKRSITWKNKRSIKVRLYSLRKVLA